MKKMRTLFKQDENFKVINEIRESNLFVLDGDFSVSLKRDGTSVFIKDNIMHKRYDANEKKGRKIPEGAIFCQDKPGPTGSFPVWIPVSPKDKYHLEAFNKKEKWKDGTYELCGPRINGNKENLGEHILIKHGEETVEIDSVDFDYLKEFLREREIEGLIFKNLKNGEMSKLRRKDFGFEW